jgi:outer membrane lipoprotein-sorting protein
MRKHVVLSLALILVFVTAISASAKTHTKDKYHRMHGDVESVDSAAGTFTVKHGNDSSTFKTDSSTKIRGGGKVITLADLKPGDDVRVSFTESGADKTAARVDVAHGKKM